MITTYSETDLDLKVNKIDRETFDTLSTQQISPKELWFITSADSVVVDIDKIGQGGTDYGPEISELSANKRDYTDLTYNDKTVRAPTYGIGKMTATPNDGSDPIVMDTFFIHENEGGTSLGSCWYKASYLYCGTTDGTNFTLVNLSFQTLTTFTKTQLLAGEVTFTYQNKEWTLTAELGDGMVDSFDITINTFTWHTNHYDYDPQTKTSKWWNQQDGFFLTREWTSSGTVSNYWQASLYRGDDGVHGNVRVAQFNIGGTVGYRAGGYLPTFTYGDITQPIAWQVAGHPCQGTFGFSECIPTRNSQLINDSQFVRQSEMSAFTSNKRDLSALQYTGLDLDDRFSQPFIEQKGIRNFTVSIPNYPDLSGDLVLSAVAYGSAAQTWWGNPSASGNNIYMECRLTSEQDGIYQFSLYKGSMSSHQTIHTFTSEEIAAGVAPFQFTENDVTYDGVVSAQFATTRLATVNDISNHSVNIDGQAILLNAPYDQSINISKIPVTIGQDFSYDSTNYTFEWYDGSNTQYWNTNYNSKSQGVGTLTIMLPTELTVGDCLSWAINQGFYCEYCDSGTTYHDSLSNIQYQQLSLYPYLRIVIGA